MKKLLCILFSLLLLFSLTACAFVGEEAGQALLEEAAEAALDALGESSSPTEEPAPPADTLPPAEETAPPSESQEEPGEEPAIDPDGSYTSKEDVSLYLYTYGCLPGNFITKDEARDLGWEGGSLEEYAPGKSIGGDYFGNYEGLLPEAPGRDYFECDIDTQGASRRGAKRIVYSNDGLIYYTGDHYESFELLYGDENA